MADPDAAFERGLAVALGAVSLEGRATAASGGPALPPARSRGVIALLEDNCTVCMLCARECPDWCIHIDSHTETVQAGTGGRPRQNHVLDRFAIDFSLCMYCGICVEACPFDALFWSPVFDYPGQGAVELTHEKQRLREWLGSVPAEDSSGD